MAAILGIMGSYKSQPWRLILNIVSSATASKVVFFMMLLTSVCAVTVAMSMVTITTARLH